MEKSKLEKFFENFKTIEKKYLTRKERNYYCSCLEAILEYLNSDLDNNRLLMELLKVPSTDWDIFFKKINILDRNYRNKYKNVYGCYEFFIKSRKKIGLSNENKSKTVVSGKKFVKSIVSLIKWEANDDLVDNLINKSLSIKQLLKIYHLLNFYLKEGDYRRSFLLSASYEKLTNLIKKYAKKSDIKSHKYFDGGIYPFDKYKDVISYIYLRYRTVSMKSIKDKRISLEISGSDFEKYRFSISDKYRTEPCTIFNSHTPIFSKDNYVEVSLENIENTFNNNLSKKFLLGIFEIKSTSKDYYITFKVTEKRCGIYCNNICSQKIIPLNTKKISKFIMIYDPVSESLLFGENIPIPNYLNSKICENLFRKLIDSCLSIESIFSRDDLSGELGYSDLAEIMNKNM